PSTCPSWTRRSGWLHHACQMTATRRSSSYIDTYPMTSGRFRATCCRICGRAAEEESSAARSAVVGLDLAGQAHAVLRNPDVDAAGDRASAGKGKDGPHPAEPANTME